LILAQCTPCRLYIFTSTCRSTVCALHMFLICIWFGILNEYNQYNPQQQVQVPTTFETSEFPIRHSLRSLAVCAQCLLQYSANSCHHKTHYADIFCFGRDCALFEECSLSDDILCEQLNSHA